ncbi:MAG: ABC transporter permease subunit [Proteobacteria bacterium]|nr:ABC transporter permease subunit [Pseudomonadota bacterium]
MNNSLWTDALYRLKKNKLALLGASFLVLELLIFFLIPLIVRLGYEAQDLELTFAAPSLAHWFGTDSLGRDLFSRVIFGGRVSLTVGLLASLVSAIVGVIYGSLSGFLGGKIDNLMMRIVDILYALPFIFLVIILMVYFGRNFILLFVALGLTQWLTMARIVRGQVLSLRHKEFVEAANSLGLKQRDIVLKHLIPNTLGPVIVYLTLTVPSVILEEAFLSYLGLGIQAPLASWGTLIKEGVDVMDLAPWTLFFPAFFLSATLFSLNFLGDGLRDALDPKGARD